MTDERLHSLIAEYGDRDQIHLLRQVEREAFAEGISAHETKRLASPEQFRRVHRSVMKFRCGCGGKKLAGVPFCKDCFSKIPKDLSLRLYPAYRHIFALSFLEAECLLGFTEAVQQGAE